LKIHWRNAQAKKSIIRFIAKYFIVQNSTTIAEIKGRKRRMKKIISYSKVFILLLILGAIGIG